MNVGAASVQPVHGHIRELRTRTSWCAAIFMAGALLGYLWHVPIIQWLEHPLGQKLFYTSPMGGFQFLTHVCLLVGGVVVLPAAIYHILRFVEPALPRRLTHRFIVTVIAASYSLLLAGAAFAYYVSIPTALRFFGGVTTGQLQAIITADGYFNFVFAYISSFALIFQLPLLLLLINNIKPIDPGALGRIRKYVIVASFGLGLLVAPEPVSQTLLALPVVILYEFSIGLVAIANHRKRKSRRTTPAAAKAAAVAVTQKPVTRPSARPAQILDLRDSRTTVARPRKGNVLDLR